MKGVVFTEFLDMVSTVFGENMVDDILDDCVLESNGSYTTAGTYNYREIIEIVRALSQRTGIPINDLFKNYGYHLFSRFNTMMPQFFQVQKDTFEFLESVDKTIHVEVKKLYPEAVLPKFSTERLDENELLMTYKSRCPFADFASGLIAGCIHHFNENITIENKDENDDTYFIRHFILKRYVR